MHEPAVGSNGRVHRAGIPPPCLNWSCGTLPLTPPAGSAIRPTVSPPPPFETAGQSLLWSDLWRRSRGNGYGNNRICGASESTGRRSGAADRPCSGATGARPRGGTCGSGRYGQSLARQAKGSGRPNGAVPRCWPATRQRSGGCGPPCEHTVAGTIGKAGSTSSGEFFTHTRSAIGRHRGPRLSGTCLGSSKRVRGALGGHLQDLLLRRRRKVDAAHGADYGSMRALMAVPSLWSPVTTVGQAYVSALAAW